MIPPFSFRLVLRAVFFVSGAAALVFETLWFRQAGLTFGNSAEASSIVLSAFMAGLALGNHLVARVGDRIWRPLRVFAAAEGCVAVSGALLVWVLPSFSSWLSPLFASLLDYPILLNVNRLLIGFLLLLIPSTAMGVTLPLLVKALTRVEVNYGSALGGLYGWNTLGAVAGAVCGQAAISSWGIYEATGLAFSLDILAGGAVLVLLRDSSAADNPVDKREKAVGSVRLVLTAAFLSGGCLLALEVVWFRFLHLFVQSTSLAFSLMLAVVLSGIGIGGACGGALMARRQDADRFASPLAFLSGAVCVGFYAVFGSVHDALGRPFAVEATPILVLTATLVLPVAALSGFLFTFIGSLLNRCLASETEATGRMAFWNTLGAGAGALAGGYLLLPQVGVEGALWVVALTYGGIGLLLRSESWGSPWVAAPAVVLLSALILFPFGAVSARHYPAVASRFGYPRTARIAITHEGLTETIIYLENHLAGVPVSYQLVTNGFSMASNSVFNRRYMKLYTYLPVALHGDIRSALLISYGVGSTARSLVDSRGIERINMVDISRDVFALSRIPYPDPGANPVLDPRVTTIVEDGRQFLQVTPQRYDLITSEPPPPKHAGVVSLYTREYFALIHDRLTEGGICSYWLPVHTLDPSQTLAITRAFLEVFEDASMWTGSGTNWMLIGSRDGIRRTTTERFIAQWRDTKLRPELSALGLEHPGQLGALFMSDAAHLVEMTRGVEPVVDAYPGRLGGFRVDRASQKDVYSKWMDVGLAGERFRKSDYIEQILPSEIRRSAEGFFSQQGVVNTLLAEQASQVTPPWDPTSQVRDLHNLLERTSLTTLPKWHLRVWEDLLTAIRQLSSRQPLTGPYRTSLAAAALAERNYTRAASIYKEALDEGRPSPAVVHLALYALIRAGEIDEAMRRAGRVSMENYDPDYWRWLGGLVGRQVPVPG